MTNPLRFSIVGRRTTRESEKMLEDSASVLSSLSEITSTGMYYLDQEILCLGILQELGSGNTLVLPNLPSDLVLFDSWGYAMRNQLFFTIGNISYNRSNKTINYQNSSLQQGDELRQIIFLIED